MRVHGVVLNYADGQHGSHVNMGVDWIYQDFTWLQCQAVVNMAVYTEVLGKTS